MSSSVNRWRFIFLLVLFFIRVGSGLFGSIFGPTLLYLADNVDSSISSVAYLFTGRSGGLFVGAAICSFLIRKYPSFRPLLTSGVSVVVTGGIMIAVPFITNIAGLVLLISFTGLTYGYLDTAVVSLFLKLWGQSGSRSILQGYHFASSFGSMLAPMIAKPFLEMVEAGNNDGTSSYESTCPNSNYSANDSEASINLQNVTTYVVNPMSWPYIITGGFTIPSGFVLVYLAMTNIETKMTNTQHMETTKEVNHQTDEEPLKDVLLLFVAVVLFYFGISSVEGVFQSYIYSVALCSKLAFSVSDSAWLNTLFWIGVVSGRGTGIFVSRHFHPKVLIICSLTGTTIATTLFAALGETVPLIVWFIAIFHGFCVATLYSSGISWTSQITNISTTYVFIFSMGNAAGNMSMPTVAGMLFEVNPFDVVYLLVGVCGFSVIMFAVMCMIGKHHKTPVLPNQEGNNLPSGGPETGHPKLASTNDTAMKSLLNSNLLNS